MDETRFLKAVIVQIRQHRSVNRITFPSLLNVFIKSSTWLHSSRSILRFGWGNHSEQKPDRVELSLNVNETSEKEGWRTRRGWS